MKCSNSTCGADGPGKFCPECGHKMVEVVESDTMMICSGILDDGSVCNTELVPGQKFCVNCGEKVVFQDSREERKDMEGENKDFLKSSDAYLPHDSDDDSSSEDENHKITKYMNELEERRKMVAIERTEENSAVSNFLWKRLLPGAVIGTAAVVAAPFALAAVGFGAGGIIGGSYAAGMMSSAAIANGGGVAAGGAVAMLQSAGAAGISAAANAGIFSVLTATTTATVEAGSRIKDLVVENGRDENFSQHSQTM